MNNINPLICFMFLYKNTVLIHIHEDGNYYDWGCGDAFQCEAFTRIGNSNITSDCVHIDFTVKLTTPCNTKFHDNTVSINEYHYCCEGAMCNDMDINISQCREDAWLNNWYSEFIS